MGFCRLCFLTIWEYWLFGKIVWNGMDVEIENTKKRQWKNVAGQAGFNSKVFQEWGRTMKKSSQQKVKKSSQSVYTKILSSLRNSVSSEYSRVLNRKTRGMILGYDWSASHCFACNQTAIQRRISCQLNRKRRTQIKIYPPIPSNLLPQMLPVAKGPGSITISDKGCCWSQAERSNGFFK